MNHSLHRGTRLLSFLSIFASLLLPCVYAASDANGTIAGRVFSAKSGTYLNNALVTIPPLNVTVATDPYGYFRINDLPPGPAKIRIFYTGLPVEERLLTVKANESIFQEVTLGTTKSDDSTDTVKMDPFQVVATGDINAAALAIQEQRVASNIKTVAAVDSFADITDGNTGQLLKLLPGVTMDFDGVQPNTVSVGGMPSSATPIMIDGNRLASAFPATRATEVTQVSINSLSRVEVSRAPTPDSPADAIGGSVNMISKSAFERSRPAYTIKTWVAFRDKGLSDPTLKIKPSVEAEAVVPLNKKIGFTFNAASTTDETTQYITFPTFSPNAQATSANFPATTPDHPYFATYQYSNAPKVVGRDSAAITFDWRVGASDVLTLGMMYSFYHEDLFGMPRGAYTVNPGRIVSFGPTFSQGAPGTGFVQRSDAARAFTGTTYMPSLRWRHTGPIWTIVASGAYSSGNRRNRDIGIGVGFNTLSTFLRNVTVRFDNGFGLAPPKITLTDASGALVDYTKIGNYHIESGAYYPDRGNDTADIQRSANLSAQRNLELRIPLALKVGLETRGQTRDILNASQSFTFLGADKLAGSADDLAGPWADSNYPLRWESYNLPHTEGVSQSALAATFKTHPEYFSATDSDAVTQYRAAVTNSKRITEQVSAGYLRLDALNFFNSRMSVTGGVRYELTSDAGQGGLINPSLIYQRDSSGAIVRTTAGQPVVIAPLATLAGTKLAYKERATKVNKSYGDFYPSVNASYKFTPDLIGRISYAQTINRPDFTNILPSLNLPDETTTSRTITLTNPSLKPWSAKSVGLSMEYYFHEPSSGIFTVRAYRRDISDFWGTVVSPISDDLISIYGLNPSLYSAAQGFLTSSTQNVGNARVSSLEFDYRQTLGMLPSWFGGVTVFANMAMQHLQGPTTASFIGFVQRTVNAGFTYNRSRLTLRGNVNMRGRERRENVVGTGIEAGTYTYRAPMNTVDLSTELRLTRKLTAFATVRNLFDATLDWQRYGPSTPDYARLYQSWDFRPLYSIGLKGTF